MRDSIAGVAMTAVDVVGLLVVAAVWQVGKRWPAAQVAVWICVCVWVASVVAEWGMK